MATDYYPTSTDPPPATVAERDAMVRLAERWETGADNLEHAIADGASRHLSEVETLRNCAHELRRTLSAGRPGAQSAGASPTPDVDPLNHVSLGDPDPTLDRPEAHCGQTRHPDGWGPMCTRLPHPGQWRHIAGNSRLVVAMWTDEPKPGADS